jgi:TonB-dependent receptor
MAIVLGVSPAAAQEPKPTPKPASTPRTGLQADPVPTDRDGTGVTAGGSSTTSPVDATTQSVTGQSATGGTAQDGGTLSATAGPDIIVTGYRRSLEDSANAKKNATNFIDSIYSEDVGKFPDLNLAESLQRLPGVQIDRDRGGEGTTINVRGLSAGFTVTTINGFNTTTSAYSGNEGRGSGLDVLPNEIFRRLTLSKSPTASTVEGGTAGVVDLQPLRAFDRKGFNVSVQGQGQYQDANGTTTPRGAVIVSNRWNTGIGEFGVLGSVAYAKRDYRSESFDTIGWTTLNINTFCPAVATATISGCNSRNILTGGYGGGSGVPTNVPANIPASLNAGTAGSRLVPCLNNTPGGTSGLSCQDLSYLLIPRLMRAEQTIGNRSRLGGSFNLEYRPIPELRFHTDVLFSDVKNRFRQNQLMMVTRSYNNIVPVNFVQNEDHVITSGTFANTYFLNQSQQGNTPSKLFYRSGGVEWDIMPDLRFSASGMRNSGRLLNEATEYTLQSAPGRVPNGTAGGVAVPGGFSPAGRPQVNITGIDLVPVTTGQYGIYSYTPGDLTPSIESNVDFSNFSNYYWNGASVSVSRQRLEQQAYRFDLVGGNADTFQLSTGFMKNIFDRRIESYGGGLTANCFLRGVCGTNFVSSEKSLLEAIPNSDIASILSPLPSVPLFKGAPFNAGFNGGWLVPDFDKIASRVNVDYFQEGINPGNTAANYLNSYARRDLKEDTTAGYLMAEGRQDIFDRELRFNLGVRYASTFQSANGRVNDAILLGGTGVSIQSFSNKYDNWLPSVSLAYFLTKNLLLRGAAARTVTGVSPSDLLPGLSVSTDGSTYTRGNPKLQPFYADNFDVGIEWYPRSRTVVTFNAWWKNLFNYPYILRTQQSLRQTGLDFTRLTDVQRNNIQNAVGVGGDPYSYIINVEQRDNTDLVIKLAGQEAAWAQPTDFLLRGTGFNVNVTHIKQSLQGNVPAGLSPNALLAGLAPWTYNATAYYETKAFQIRLSFVHRDENINTVCPCDNVPGDRYTVATNYLDSQLTIPVPWYPKAVLTLQAQNLLQQVTLSRNDKQEARPYNAQYAGRNYVVGLRANF